MFIYRRFNGNDIRIDPVGIVLLALGFNARKQQKIVPAMQIVYTEYNFTVALQHCIHISIRVVMKGIKLKECRHHSREVGAVLLNELNCIAVYTQDIQGESLLSGRSLTSTQCSFFLKRFMLLALTGQCTCTFFRSSGELSKLKIQK